LVRQLEAEPSPIVAVFNGVGVGFGWDYGLTPAVRHEFEALRSRVLDIFRSKRFEPAPVSRPLEVRELFDESGYSFELTSDSVNRVVEAHCAGAWIPVPFHVRAEVMMDFQFYQGDIIPAIVV